MSKSERYNLRYPRFCKKYIGRKLDVSKLDVFRTLDSETGRLDLKFYSFVTEYERDSFAVSLYVTPEGVIRSVGRLRCAHELAPGRERRRFTTMYDYMQLDFRLKKGL